MIRKERKNSWDMSSLSRGDRWPSMDKNNTNINRKWDDVCFLLIFGYPISVLFDEMMFLPFELMGLF